ncbi:MAG: hypothetical protein LBD07_06275 [Spirochaetaceae bacterium]|jgi:hypothetical protein|nr:hypothetical protein [Spirochaetaceae bacterium]
MEQEKLFERIYHIAHLREMATRWHPSDEGGKWPMWIKIGSGTHSDGQGEHGFPHAHFESKNGETGVFSIKSEAPPKNYNEIIVIEGEISPNWKKILVKWANSPAKVNNKLIGLTKWEQARDDWEVNRG